jgi:hypothetical protein
VPELPGDCDGTALVSADGSSLWVRYPAAAGDGSAGEVRLAEPPGARDLHATRLLVPAEVRVDLSARRGPVVLRSQTSLRIEGTLVRRGSASEPRPSPLVQELREDADRYSDRPQDDPERPSLGPWLQRLLESEEPWTVLIAGGDLTVTSGALLEVDGPLLLVAGGWIRALGSVSTQADLWRTNESSGGFAAHAKAGLLPYLLEAPATNPLVVPFRAGYSLRLGHNAGRSVVPLSSSSSWRVLVDREPVTDAEPRLHVRFELWPRPSEAWRTPASSFELGDEPPARDPR